MYIAEETSELHDTIFFKDTHPQLPLIRIIDPAKQVPIEKIKETKSIFSKT